MLKLTTILTITLLFFAPKTPAQTLTTPAQPHKPSAQPQKYYDLTQQALSRYIANHFDSATQLYKQAFAVQSPSTWRPYAFAAGTAAKAGNRELAFQWLDKAFQNGLPTPQNIEKNSDL